MVAIAARRWLCLGVATVAATLVATTVSAQALDAVRMPLWDAGASLAAAQTRASELGYEYDYWESQWEPGIQLGRYLTPHLKLEMSVRGPMQYHFYEDEPVPVPAIPGGIGRSIVDSEIQLFSLAPAVTWQFFENTFVHPYVSVGVAVDVANIHRSREAHIETFYLTRGSVSYPVPALDTREIDVRAYPFLAAGSKSYFANGRWFVRPEIEIGVGRSRVAQYSMRLGVGVDF
ncbi:MAG TPA: hypothetical protein VM096_02845 [Vicinamibacterales bacterium]|nr:hypothetical protein [Vicinamibacterales bacterium]